MVGALQEAHDDLEKQVKQRTAELVEAVGRLRELDSLKSMFIASMSHELRTPLNAIIGFTGLILGGRAGEVSQEQRRQLTMVKKSADHLLALINDVIDVSRIEAGQLRLEAEEFDLAGGLRDIEQSFATRGGDGKVRLSLRAPRALPVVSDRRRVAQVVMNLVSNALKFTEQGEVSIEAAEEESTVVVTVRDSGVGIRSDKMVKLFRPFSRVREKGVATKEGTGLGLYLSREIARMLGGTLTARSELGQGSEFVFTLPRQASP